MKYNLKPTFKAIRYFEVLTNTPFTDIENNPLYFVQLLYCCLIAHPENNFNMTFEEATEFFKGKTAVKLVEDFQKELAILGQFKMSSKEDNKTIDNKEKSSPEEPKSVFLSSIIPILVKDCGLDINYVMNEMNYTDTELFINNSIERKRDEMETQRFWTYLNILPHVSSKKLKEPQDLIEFPWEKNEKKEKAIEKMKADRAKLIEIGMVKEDNVEQGEDE